MLLIHTADLHLGKTLHERELVEEQSAVLDDLVGVLAERKPSALLLAGDIYDRAIPPPSAIGLLDRFLSRAVETAPGTAIVIIPGNHDSASRLAFGSGLFRRAGVHVRSRVEESLEPVMIEARSDSGNGETCAIWALPFLSGGAGDSESGLRGQASLFADAVDKITQRLDPALRNVLVAHCFASGGMTSDSERAFVGLAEEVDASLFDPFDYVALGHLHRPQRAGAKGHYSGAPLPYSFGEALRVGRDGEAVASAAVAAVAAATAAEADRGFLAVELGDEGASVTLIPHRPRRRLARIEGAFADFCVPGAFAEFRDDFIEVSLSDGDPVFDPSSRLKEVFPNLLSIRQAAFEPRQGGSATPLPDRDVDSRAADDPARVLEDFAAFHRDMLGVEPDAARVELFRSLVEEASREAG